MHRWEKICVNVIAQHQTSTTLPDYQQPCWPVPGSLATQLSVIALLGSQQLWYSVLLSNHAAQIPEAILPNSHQLMMRQNIRCHYTSATLDNLGRIHRSSVATPNPARFNTLALILLASQPDSILTESPVGKVQHPWLESLGFLAQFHYSGGARSRVGLDTERGTMEGGVLVCDLLCMVLAY